MGDAADDMENAMWAAMNRMEDHFAYGEDGRDPDPAVTLCVDYKDITSWMDKYGDEHDLKDMSLRYLYNCMRMCARTQRPNMARTLAEHIAEREEQVKRIALNAPEAPQDPFMVMQTPDGQVVTGFTATKWYP